jgi:antitoxin CptB
LRETWATNRRACAQAAKRKRKHLRSSSEAIAQSTARDPQGIFMDGLEIRRKRALYRANHRGTKELDLILGRYASERVPGMDEATLAAFEEFLALPDTDIDQWIRGFAAPDGVVASVADIRGYLGLEK